MSQPQTLNNNNTNINCNISEKDELFLLQQYRQDIMKLFEKEIMSDLTLVVGPSKFIGQEDDEDVHPQQIKKKISSKLLPIVDNNNVVEFKVHRSILCARCDYFNKLFHSPMKDSMKSHLKFPDKRPDDFKCLLDYFYSAKININHSNAFGVLKLSDELGVQIVREKCIEYVKDCVTRDNVFDVLEESSFHNFEELKRFCKEYLEMNAKEMFFSESFMNITKETLIDLLKSDKIHLGELEIFKAVIIWGKNQLIKSGVPLKLNNQQLIPLNTNLNNITTITTNNQQKQSSSQIKTTITYATDGTTTTSINNVNNSTNINIIANTSPTKSTPNNFPNSTPNNNNTLKQEDEILLLQTEDNIVNNSITDRNLSISEQPPRKRSIPELSVSELAEDNDNDKTDVDAVDDDDEMELMEMYTYSALNPESMLTSSNKQDVEDIKEKKESMQKVINYTHDKNFTQQLSKLLLDVLYHVRFPILDPQEVYELIEPSKVVSAELLLEAYRCHALQNRIELLTAPRLKVREGSLFYVSGVVENVQIGKLKGWTLFYHKPYHHPTTEVDLQPAKGTRILVGARHKNSNSLALCAMGRKEKVLKETFENETTKENGCYFYHWKNHSFGFSDTNVVQLGTADLSTDSKLKLSWHLTGRGGYRCGLLTSLNESKEWEKMLFYA